MPGREDIDGFRTLTHLPDRTTLGGKWQWLWDSLLAYWPGPFTVSTDSLSGQEPAGSAVSQHVAYARLGDSPNWRVVEAEPIHVSFLPGYHTGFVGQGLNTNNLDTTTSPYGLFWPGLSGQPFEPVVAQRPWTLGMVFEIRESGGWDRNRWRQIFSVRGVSLPGWVINLDLHSVQGRLRVNWDNHANQRIFVIDLSAGIHTLLWTFGGDDAGQAENKMVLTWDHDGRGQGYSIGLFGEPSLPSSYELRLPGSSEIKSNDTAPLRYYQWFIADGNWSRSQALDWASDPFDYLRPGFALGSLGFGDPLSKPCPVDARDRDLALEAMAREAELEGDSRICTLPTSSRVISIPARGRATDVDSNDC